MEKQEREDVLTIWAWTQSAPNKAVVIGELYIEFHHDSKFEIFLFRNYESKEETLYQAAEWIRQQKQ